MGTEGRRRNTNRDRLSPADGTDRQPGFSVYTLFAAAPLPGRIHARSARRGAFFVRAAFPACSHRTQGRAETGSGRGSGIAAKGKTDFTAEGAGCAMLVLRRKESAGRQNEMMYQRFPRIQDHRTAPTLRMSGRCRFPSGCVVSCAGSAAGAAVRFFFAIKIPPSYDGSAGWTPACGVQAADRYIIPRIRGFCKRMAGVFPASGKGTPGFRENAQISGRCLCKSGTFPVNAGQSCKKMLQYR